MLLILIGTIYADTLVADFFVFLVASFQSCTREDRNYEVAAQFITKRTRNATMMNSAMMRGVRVAKTVKPYDADWDDSLSLSLFVASPACMAVSTTTMYIHRRRCQLDGIVFEKIFPLMSMRYSRVQEQRPAHETINFNQTVEAEFFVLKLFVNFVMCFSYQIFLSKLFICFISFFWKANVFFFTI